MNDALAGDLCCTMASSNPRKRKHSVVDVLEKQVLKIADKLQSLHNLTTTLNVPKELAQKMRPKGRVKRVGIMKNSQLDSGKVVLHEVNELIDMLEDLRSIKGANKAIYVPHGVVDAMDLGVQDPNVFLVDRLNSLLDHEKFIRSRQDRFERFSEQLKTHFVSAVNDANTDSSKTSDSGPSAPRDSGQASQDPQ